LNGIKVTLNNLRRSQEGVQKEDGTVDSPGENYDFVIAELTLENTTGEPKPIYVAGEFRIWDTYSGDNYTDRAELNADLVKLSGSTLAPGAKITGELPFVISKDSKDLRLVYSPIFDQGEINFQLDR
jgi:hypothetical protein